VACAVAERICDRVRNEPFELPDGGGELGHNIDWRGVCAVARCDRGGCRRRRRSSYV
jgi:hypothetical protein